MSSTPNKRLIDEGGNGSGNYGHSSAAKYQHEDSSSFPGVGAKVMSSTPGESHVPYEVGQDSRMPKFPRMESRDVDRRITSLPVFRALNASSHDHIMGPESRSDFRDLKDSNRDHKFESREPRVESRDFYQRNKAVDVKFDSRGGENKDTKDGHFEHRGDLRTDKDAYGGPSTHTNWKDPNESLVGKRYLDTSGGNMDPWHTSRSSLHVSGEKDAAHYKEKDYAESREAVGENKVDMRGDDKFKEKDRKRKEGKHREWGERDRDRNDRRNDSENKDVAKNERETERWEKERKDLCKEKEKVKDRDKDYIKKEAGTGAEIDSNDKDLLDVPGRAAELEKSSTELKKVKDGDDLRTGDKDPKDRKKDRDMDAEERFDPCNRLQGKEPDEGCGDVEGSTEKDKEGFSHGIPQRKKMLRPKESPQRANRDPASRSQGETDVSTVIYKVGECMQELIKLWKEFESSQADRMSESSLIGPTLDIRIPAEHISATNRHSHAHRLCRPTASPPPATIQELRITIRVLPPQDSYVSSLRNNVRSRAWGSGIGCSYRVERCCIVKKEGGLINLEPCLTHSSTLEPTLAPVAVERTMTTRAAASNALRQQRFVREVTIQFNLCCEPWLKYSISVVADKGLKKANYTSSRLKKGEVLYLETHSCRYELCFNGEKMVKAAAAAASTASQAHGEMEVDKSQNHHSLNCNGSAAADAENGVVDVFRWSRCKKALPQRMMKTVGIPLPLEHVQVLEDNLEWEEIRWSSTSVHINGKEYSLARAHFLSLH